MQKKVAILIVAYNAASTITKVLDRIPAGVKNIVEEIMIFDNASPDNTNLVAEDWKQKAGLDKLSIFRNQANEGYGGNQKLGYAYAIKKGYDIVVMLHADGQYAPEMLPAILAPLIEEKADAVFGSRMLVRGAARRGGMPFYKYVGNKVLTFLENLATGARLSEWHSGYRAYTTKALRMVNFQKNTGDYHFDSEIIIQFVDRGLKIVELPIPTYYGDEICYVNGLKYAALIMKSVCQYLLHKAGLRSYEKYERPVV
ncbi:glycosyltransferase family 2 protein [Patescibacteria group bacterium]|nr:MAG: glycosyltransferase family 2 protein [Patescibacteria group bacterium]